MKRFLKFIAVVSLFTYAACTADSVDYSDEIADLTDRVEALESLEDALSEAISGVETLILASTGGDITISTVTEAASGVYKLVLSDGTIVYAGNSINYAAGEVTMRVTEGGTWQYSDDGGKTWTDVTNENGDLVETVVAGSAWYETITVEDGVFKFTIAGDDKEYTIPVIADFSVIIDDSALVKFGYGSKQTLPVAIKGASDVVVACSEGWSAKLSGEEMTITAPESVDGGDVARVSSLNYDGEVRLMIFSKSGHVATSTIVVSIDPMALVPPTVEIVDLVVSEADASVYVILDMPNSVTNAYYIVKPAGEVAPTVDEFKDVVVLNDFGRLVIEDLDTDANYTLYIMAVSSNETETLYSDIQSKSFYVPVPPIDYYEDGYAADNGETYSAMTEGAQLITEDTTISADGVYFVESDVKITLAKATYSNLVIVGRHSDAKPRVEMVTGNSTFGAGEGVIFKNLDIEQTAASYMFNMFEADMVIKNWIVEDCRVKTYEGKGLTYFSQNNAVIANTYLKGNTIIFTTLSTGKILAGRFLAYNNTMGDNASQIAKVEITNNVVYATELPIGLQMFYAKPTSTVDNDSSNVEINVANNLFVNAVTNNNMITLPNAKSISSTNNIFWASDDIAVTSYYVYYTGAGVSTMPTMSDVYYGLASSNDWCAFNSTSTFGYDAENNKYTKEATNPLAKCDIENGIFEVAAEYSTYGPQAE